MHVFRSVLGSRIPGFLALAILAFGVPGTILSEETVVLPAAASLVGVAPFFSDVRVFNSSYADEVVVTATYHCFVGPCPGAPTVLHLAIGPRESVAFDDMVAVAFLAPDTGGGVEFRYEGVPGQVVVTSRLYSTEPEPTVGMFISGLPLTAAYARTILGSIRNGGDDGGFRTNVGLYNPGDAAVEVVFRIYDEFGVQVGGNVARQVGAHSGVQVSGLFGAAGASDFETGNATVGVEASGAVISYAAVIDNNTTDPIFVVGASDVGTPVTTVTPGGPTTTATRTRTRTQTNTPGTPTASPTGTPPTAVPTETPTAPAPTTTPTTTVTGTPPTLTNTSTPTVTPTLTATVTLTPTVSETPTVSPTPTLTPTLTPTETTTPSPTSTETPTLTPTVTLTPTP